jgi:hypothetical protein
MSTHTNENDPAFPATARLVRHDPAQGILATERLAEGGLTAREHAAIHLRIPVSGNEWLDAMITEARRWDAAQAALAWLPHTGCGADLHNDDAAEAVFQLANALTRQMKGGAR